MSDESKRRPYLLYLFIVNSALIIFLFPRFTGGDFELADLGDAEVGLAMLAFDQLTAHFIRHGEKLSAAKIRTDQLHSHSMASCMIIGTSGAGLETNNQKSRPLSFSLTSRQNSFSAQPVASQDLADAAPIAGGMAAQVQRAAGWFYTVCIADHR